MTDPAAKQAGPRLSVLSWCMYDWANSAFNTVIGTFVFSVYFARAIYGDETAGSAQWGYVIGWAGLVVALLSPVLGAIADHAGRRKPWLWVFTLLTVIPTALLWYAEPSVEFVAYTLGLVFVASVAFELAGVFYNAMLSGVAPPHMLGRVSGWGWGLGYIGGLACLAVALFALVGMGELEPLIALPTENSENIRAVGPLVAWWFLIFALPLFIVSRDRPARDMTAARAVREGMATLNATLKRVWKQGNILRFLIASALYRDGLATLFAVGGLYAAGTFKMEFEQILVFAIGMNVTAGLGAAAFAFMDDIKGSKKTVIVSLLGLLAFGIPTLLISDADLFIVLALGLGIFVGPAQAASRSLMARLAPPDEQTEMFGLYALTGKSIAFLGPILFAVLTDLFDSQRAGMASIIAFLGLGLLILLGVQETNEKQEHDR